MTTLPATMQNAYLARGIKMTFECGDNPAYLLATLMVAGGGYLNPLMICEMAAWYDELVELFPAPLSAPRYSVIDMGRRWFDEMEMNQSYNDVEVIYK